jgi:Tol biopolymer transport system component
MEDDVTQFAGQPAYSPDGSLIAFTARIPDVTEHAELFAAAYVANADGSDVRLIARGAWPAGWLPDGRVVLVDEQSSELRAVDLQTTDAEQLGESPGPAALAPDGSRVLLSKFDPVSGAGSVELRTIDGDALAALDGSVGGWAPDSGAALVLDLEATGGFVVIDRDGAVLETYELPDPFNVFWVAWRPRS